jgi:hypothetical protein
MEWLYRVMQEPRRLSGRYFLGGPVFIGHVISHAVGYWAAALARNLLPGRKLQHGPLERGSDGL